MFDRMYPDGPLTEFLSADFSKPAADRGRTYYLRGRVVSARLADEYAFPVVSGVVRGSDRYDVHIGIDEDDLYCHCDCMAFERMDECKHVFALACHADVEGLSLALLEQSVGHSVAHDAHPWMPDHRRSAQGTTWQERLERLEQDGLLRRDRQTPKRPAVFEVSIDVEACRADGALHLELFRRPYRKGGVPGDPVPARWTALASYSSMAPEVMAVLSRLVALEDRQPWQWRHRRSDNRLTLPHEHAAHAVEMAVGAMPVRIQGRDGDPLSWSDEPWRFRLRVEAAGAEDEADNEALSVVGELVSGDRVRTLADAVLLLRDGPVLFADEAAPLDHAGGFEWIAALRGQGPLTAGADEREPFLQRLLRAAHGIPLDLGALAERRGPPSAQLDLKLADGEELPCAVRFAYGSDLVAAASPDRYAIGGEGSCVYERDGEAEQALLGLFFEAGGRRARPDWHEHPFTLPAADLPARCGRLIEAGWEVLAERRALRTHGELSIRVRSGIDWFDLEGEAEFDGAALALPEILRAAADGRRVLELDSGGLAFLPPEWMARLEALGALAGTDSEEVRVPRARAPLLDAVLTGAGTVEVDASFEQLRRSLRRFRQIRPRKETAGFRGELRGYQRDALGWIAFLRSAGLGGCLADDMGLGKTVQVLAALVPRRRAKGRRGPSLVVAPRSVLSNWARECERFTNLRVALYHGPERAKVLDDACRYDIVLTTYGTLLRDVDRLADVAFDYVVLDEAQAIKNPRSKSARAACRLDAAHRLALTGTPIENHMEELGSLFAFLNPGLLGSRREFQALLGSGTPSPERIEWLQCALRPVILRRTREEVLDELPTKSEQVLRCRLPAAQRRAYEDIRAHYRASVLARVESRGLGRSKLHVLEALLRLRQAACHPGLVNTKQRDEPSAKLDQLLPMLAELSEAGHKALVFSQFTKFLALVRQRLDEQGIGYVYLDGRTRKRMERVDAFQNGPDNHVFLISLKAGGTGLNLTAAQYVFLLDPWWNPAVEAQAVGRAHRMGQEHPVTVYRLIGEGTVEDKVLELQDRKRALVQAVLGGVADAPLRDISREDLEHLLGT